MMVFEIIAKVLGIREVKAKKDGKTYTVVEFGIPETYEKFSVFVFDDEIKATLAGVVGQALSVSFKLRGGVSGVTLQVVGVAV